MNDYLTGFAEYLKNLKTSSANTRDSYMRDVTAFTTFVSSKGCDSPTTVTENLIYDYIDSLKEMGRSSTTVSRNVSSIRCYYKYLIFSGIASSNPAKDIKLDHVDKKLPQVLSGDEINLLLSQPDVSTAKGCRDKAMLELLYATGIRVSELINLDVQDVNLQGALLNCKGSKGVRQIPIYTSAVVAVSDYIYRMRRILIDDESNQALFVNRNGTRLTRQGFWKIIKGYAASAGIKTELTPHTLRHSFAIHLLENGASVKDIQQIMGHADISSMHVYVQLMDQHVKQVYDECHPKANDRRVR